MSRAGSSTQHCRFVIKEMHAEAYKAFVIKAPDSKGAGFSGLPVGGALFPTREREELRFFRTGSKDNHHRQS